MESAAASASKAAQLAQRAAYGPSRVVWADELFVVLDELDKLERAGEKPESKAVLDRVRKRLTQVGDFDAVRILREVSMDQIVTVVERDSEPPYLRLSGAGKVHLESLRRVARQASA